jgi:hypothetical protein
LPLVCCTGHGYFDHGEGFRTPNPVLPPLSDLPICDCLFVAPATGILIPGRGLEAPRLQSSKYPQLTKRPLACCSLHLYFNNGEGLAPSCVTSFCGCLFFALVTGILIPGRGLEPQSCITSSFGSANLRMLVCCTGYGYLDPGEGSRDPQASIFKVSPADQKAACLLQSAPLF